MASPPEKQSLGRVLVVGGNGFLGHHIVRKLQEDWTTDAIASVDLRCAHNRFPGVDYREVDITDLDALRGVFLDVRPDLVLHTASPLPQSDDPATHDLFLRVNVDGTHNVVEACRAAGVKALVFTSSASIISDNRSDLRNADERYPVLRGARQSEYYSETKAAAEEIVLNANNRSPPHKFLTASIRPAGIFGEGDIMVLKQMIRLLREGKTSVQVGDNNNIFDFTYVGNVAHAHLLAGRALLATYFMENPPSGEDGLRVDGEAFMITNGEPVYFWDFARAIWRHAGSDKGTDHVWVLGRGPGLAVGFLSEIAAALMRRKPSLTRSRIVFSCMTRYYDIGKARRALGYRPQVSLEEGIEIGCAWFRENDKAGKITW